MWALERNGFDVVVIQDDRALGYKLKEIYEQADDTFLRTDADVIVNRLCMPKNVIRVDAQWAQFKVFDWFKQIPVAGGIQVIDRELLPTLRKAIDYQLESDRPETMMSRLTEFHNPRIFKTFNTVFGIHGYGIKDYQYVKETKERRGQIGYDWPLVERLNLL